MPSFVRHHHQHQHQHHQAASSRKRNSIVAILPTSIAWLEQLTMTMRVDATTTSSSHQHRSRRDGVHYQLTLQQKSSSSGSLVEWQLSRSFEDYRAFQKRLLKLMRHGHFCTAECPWLYTFVKSYFPKKTFFGSDATCSRLAERRREALLRCLSALQTFLLNRANHGCAVVVEVVAHELLQFVLQDASKDHPLKRQMSLEGSGGRFSSESIVSTSEEEDAGSSTEMECGVCVLCDSNLDAEPCSNGSSSAGGGDFQSEASMYSSSSVSLSYTTTLSCGHQFHDECIIPKLNESMQCPTCGSVQSSSR